MSNDPELEKECSSNIEFRGVEGRWGGDGGMGSIKYSIIRKTSRGPDENAGYSQYVTSSIA